MTVTALEETGDRTGLWPTNGDHVM